MSVFYPVQSTVDDRLARAIEVRDSATAQNARLIAENKRLRERMFNVANKAFARAWYEGSSGRKASTFPLALQHAIVEDLIEEVMRGQHKIRDL